MTIGVFIPDDPHHATVLRAFAAGLRKVGMDVAECSVHDGRLFEAAVVFGIGKKAIPSSWPRGKVFARHRQHERTVIVIDTGYVQRQGYYMVGLNGLNGRAEFFNRSCPSDRWDELGVDLITRPPNGWRTILVCGQIPWDANCQDHDHRAWCRETCATLRRMTDRPVLFRPHPLAPNGVAEYGGVEAHGFADEPLDQVFHYTGIVVTWNSNTAVDAVIAGIPTVALGPGSMAKGMAVDALDRAYFERPQLPSDTQRLLWAYNLAYTQWNLKEIEAGLPQAHLLLGKTFQS